MSRIGNKAITIPQGVTVNIGDEVATIKGPKGELRVDMHQAIKVEEKDGALVISRKSNEPKIRALHGLVRSLLNNQIIGVTEGYKKTLKLVGTGYRVAAKGQGLTLSLGFSHPVEIDPENGIKFTLEGNDTIHIDGIDKHLVGQVAANIRRVKPPEPYKGKGIRYVDEVVIKKQGKTAGK